MKKPNDWEDVSDLHGTSRLRVPGGWIYRAGSVASPGLCYVPDPELIMALVKGLLQEFGTHDGADVLVQRMREVSK